MSLKRLTHISLLFILIALLSLPALGKRGKDLRRNKRQPVSCKWTDWEAWSNCTTSCGGSTRFHVRQCLCDNGAKGTALACGGGDFKEEEYCQSNCVRPVAYWRYYNIRAYDPNFQKPWPLSEKSAVKCDRGMNAEKESLTWFDIFKRPRASDKWYPLAYHYVTASLNIASGAVPSDDRVHQAMNEAVFFLRDCDGYDASELERIEEVYKFLGRFNSGSLPGTPRCEDTPCCFLQDDVCRCPGYDKLENIQSYCNVTQPNQQENGLTPDNSAISPNVNDSESTLNNSVVSPTINDSQSINVTVREGETVLNAPISNDNNTDVQIVVNATEENFTEPKEDSVKESQNVDSNEEQNVEEPKEQVQTVEEYKEQVQTVEEPKEEQVQTVEEPKEQNEEQVQTVEEPKEQNVEEPNEQVQTVEEPKEEQVQIVEEHKDQTADEGENSEPKEEQVQNIDESVDKPNTDNTQLEVVVLLPNSTNNTEENNQTKPDTKVESKEDNLKERKEEPLVKQQNNTLLVQDEHGGQGSSHTLTVGDRVSFSGGNGGSPIQEESKTKTFTTEVIDLVSTFYVIIPVVVILVIAITITITVLVMRRIYSNRIFEIPEIPDYDDDELELGTKRLGHYKRKQ